MTMKPSEVINVLMKGVDCWDLPTNEVPCELLLIGEAAFPVLVNRQGQVLIAVSQYGKGRMVVMGHESYLQYTGLTPFLNNAVGWLKGCRGDVIGVHSSAKDLASILCSPCHEVQITDCIDNSLGVYCISACGTTEAKELIHFVKNGGGLLIGCQAWQWANEQCQGKVLSDFPGNHITSVAGVYFTDTYGYINCLEVSRKVPTIPLIVRFGQDLSQDQKQLLDGISELSFSLTGVPSQLLVHGALAFPLGLDKSLGCFLAAARYGRGRVVLASHQDMLWDPNLSHFLCNAVCWLAGDRQGKGKVGINPEVKDLCPLLSDCCLEHCIVPHVSDDLSVYCCQAFQDDEAKQLLEFVAEGGGLLIGGEAWSWAHDNPCGIALVDYPGNHILNHFGLSILDQTLEKSCFPVLCPEEKIYHLRLALHEVLEEPVCQGGCLVGTCLEKLKKDHETFKMMPVREIPAYASLKYFFRKFETKVDPLKLEMPIVPVHPMCD
ncbi:TRPM8 channel-associated factor 2-like [Petaurus breviceps papuanus]|uniref:TRPM8 channel-associated factor 2-like n=1 Tax=Petaurus breviceps papuanus TaxID=3040969 RepID=UPI0036D89799